MQLFDVVRKSPFSGKTNTITIALDYADYQDWLNGELIQNAMPYLTADELEFIMTGITRDEWDETFS